MITELRRDGAKYLRTKVRRRILKHEILRPWYHLACKDKAEVADAHFQHTLKERNKQAFLKWAKSVLQLKAAH